MNEFFTHPQSAELVKSFDAIAHGLSSREHVFDDFLSLAIYSLAGGTMEEDYLRVVQSYTPGEPGKRAIDKIARLYARLIDVMTETREDILGDIFQGAITRGQNGQYFTPAPLCDLMAQLTTNDTAGKTVCDPACGSGRMLLAAAKIDRNRFFVGQDVDHRCVKICALNLALWNLYGQVIWGNTFKNERKLIYETGLRGRGVIRVIKPEKVEPSPRLPPKIGEDATEPPPSAEGPGVQGSLFDAME